MKSFFLAAFFILPWLSFGQTSEAKETGKVAVGFVFSPDYCYRHLVSVPENKWIEDHKNEQGIPKFGFTTGFSIVAPLSRAWAIESGLFFSDKGEKTKALPLFAADSGRTKPTTLQYNYHYLYLDVPVKLNYYFTSGKVKVFASAGTSANLYLTQVVKDELVFSNGRTDKQITVVSDPYLKRFNMAGIIGIGLDYGLTNKLQLRIEPVYRHSLTSVVTKPIKTYLFSAGVNFGLYLKL